MNYLHDIFISYAHLDNDRAFEGQTGWVNDFHRALEVRVAQLLGRKLNIWRDPKLTGNDIFSDAIRDRLPDSALLVSILSPRYVKSDWCKRELLEFCHHCSESSGIAVGNKARIFKVIKTPIPKESELAELQPLLGYEFFRVDPQSGHFHELDLAFGPEAKAEYWLRLDDLAQDIANLLEQLVRGPSEESSGRPVIYLAETSFDLREQRASIRRDLEARGHVVLPHEGLPLSSEHFAQAVAKYLQRATISIHLVGANYGIVPDGATQSIVELQHEAAAAQSSASTLVRLLWIPQGLQVKDLRQQSFIDRLKNNQSWNDKADLLETPLESFKTVIEEQMVALEAPPKTRPASVEPYFKPLRIYLICEQQDEGKVLDLRAYLFSQRFEVLMPLFEGEEDERRLEHDENLRSSDAVVIYHGSGHDLFLRRKLRELLKRSGDAQARPLLAQAVCMAPPDTLEKRNFQSLETLRIESGSSFSAQAWEPFLERLHPKAAIA